MSEHPSKMDSTIESAISTMSRALSQELPDFTLHVVKYNEERTFEALDTQTLPIHTHDAWPELSQKIKRINLQRHTEGFCAGFVEHIELKLFGTLKKTQHLAVCAIPRVRYHIFEDEDLNTTFLVYSAIFKGLHEYIRRTRKYRDDEDTFENTPDHVKTLRTNLMADCFAAMMMENDGIKGAIQKIAKAITTHCTSQTPHARPEHHPLPMALDGLNLVYKDLKNKKPPKTGVFVHTYNMAREVGTTYDDASLQQWVRFCLACQDMAWADHSANDILSCAIFGSDNPYIRANAQICAENLNTTPTPPKTANLYNPFMDEETNERQHLRICREVFIDILKAVEEQNNPALFLKNAKEQTKTLIEGHPLGWCAPALIEAENAYRLFKETPNAEQNEITNAFHSSCAHAKWKDLRSFNRAITTLKRKGKTIDKAALVALSENNEAYKSYATTFELLGYSTD